MAPQTTEPFIHLRVSSTYSPLVGAIKVDQIVSLCEEFTMPAVGLTDTWNLFGALDFANAVAAAKIQPVLGCTLPLEMEAAVGRTGSGDPVSAGALALYAQSERGWRNLLSLASRFYLTGEGRRLALADLQDCHEDLICLTGGAFGPVGALLRSHRGAAASALLGNLAEIFPTRLYVELQRHGSGDQLTTPIEAATEPAFLKLAYGQGLPLVATNEVCFPNREFFEAHEKLLAIRSGGDREADIGRYTPEHCFSSPHEMQQRFIDLPEAGANTVEIAQRCLFWPSEREPQLPRFVEDEDEVDVLRRLAEKGLETMFSEISLACDPQLYRERLSYEINVIGEMGFAGYFLIVADLVNWARDKNIPVGPGRGSGAGSLVAYVLRITGLDPLRYGLLFERFLNPGRASMPDIDIDFCESRRDEVFQYVRRRYGDNRVAKIISLGSLKSRAVIRDVGRVLGMSYPETDRIAKLISSEQNQPVSLASSMEKNSSFREAVEESQNTRQLYEIACRLEGMTRNVSIHAGGLVISNCPLTEVVPLYKDPKSDMHATQFTKEWVEKVGLVKFDLLGLKTLTAIQGVVDMLKERDIEIDPTACRSVMTGSLIFINGPTRSASFRWRVMACAMRCASCSLTASRI